jgi:hypothetical protein
MAVALVVERHDFLGFVSATAIAGGGMSIRQAFDKLGPTFFMGGFLDPALEGAEVVDCHFRCIEE